MSKVKYTAATTRKINEAWYAVLGLQQGRYHRDTLEGCMDLHDRKMENDGYQHMDGLYSSTQVHDCSHECGN